MIERMTDPRRHVLIVGAAPSVLDRIAPMLQRAEFAIHTSPPSEILLDLVRNTPFELVVVTYPLTGLSVHALLEATREGGSSCRRAGFLLLSAPPELGDAQHLVDHGANRAVATDWAEARLWQAFTDLLEVPPRIAVRIVVHLAVRLVHDTRLLECHTANLSRSGMLLCGPHDLRPGTGLDFIFVAPDQASPIRGRAELVRLTRPDREQLEGFGVRFISFRNHDRDRLDQFIRSRLEPGMAHGQPRRTLQ
jgi:CheY-like chemotaxis protein